MVLSSSYLSSHNNHIVSSAKYDDAVMIVDEKLRQIREQDDMRHNASIVAIITDLTNKLNLLRPSPDPDPPPSNFSNFPIRPMTTTSYYSPYSIPQQPPSQAYHSPSQPCYPP
ncbi:hypothetical protein RIF29_24574 [Crotalaria pallida]|uniref:Uncharacterized protein n=1 Tax=Crotalaria pallida TaxID=3830 RepID=A0AAN9EKT2_CROPI